MNYEGGNPHRHLIIMAIRNCEFLEVLLPAGAQKYGLAEDIEVDGQGLVHAPAGPGLGAQIDFDLIERRRLAVLR
jgi:L-alanine-DL-glutamate epimerase-like enolase superfamily enzyme